MKYLKEFRDPVLAQRILKEIEKIVSGTWSIMEVCGGQTHSLVKNGIVNLLPDNITMVHGPGCPVCVTPLELIDKAIYLARQPDVVMCSFGDMLRVPGSQSSLLEAKARGSDVRILYSPLEAVAIAQKNPDKQVVFFAVGFETTAPANALAVEHASKSGLANFSILTSHVLVPPAIEAILQDEETRIDGFLAAGHVCTVMGMEEYYPIVEKYQVPIVVTGFEPIDLLTGVLMVVKQLESGEHKLENQYSRVVKTEGNANAKALIDRVFKITDRAWRGIGNIAESGYEVRSSLDQFNANKKFNIYIEEVNENARCIAGQVLKGIKKPHECPEFGKNCTPLNPLGAPMVSSEGACAAYYNFSRAQEEIPD